LIVVPGARGGSSPVHAFTGGRAMPGTRRASLLVALLCLSSSRAFADDPYADYRILDHHWLSWTASVNGSGNHQRGQGLFGLANNGGFSGPGGSGFPAGYDSHAHQLRANLVLTLSRSPGYVSQRQIPPPSTPLQLRLRETGVLSGELSAAARERLASLYTLESSVAFAHERPTKYFWRELERLLREDGALGDGGLDAYSVQRLLEPLAFVGSAARPRGFSVGPQIVLSTQRFHSSQGLEVSQAFYQDDTLVAS